MKIIKSDRSMFKISRIGENRLYIKGGSILIPRRRSHFIDDASGYGSFPMSNPTTASNSQVYQGFVTINIPDTEFSATESGNVYLKITPEIGDSGNEFNGTINLGTGSAEESISEYARGVLIFAKLMKKKYGISSTANFSFIYQAENPESDNHGESKNLDSVSYLGVAPEYSVATHILLAECGISDDAVVIRQRHRGPLIIREPVIYYGDFGYRQNLS